TAEFRVSRRRVIDSMNLLNGYWNRMLEEQIPDDSPLLANRPAHSELPVGETTPDKTDKQPEEAKNFFQRIFFR
ncbi:MAG: hypothetical protein IKW74_05795, partial [Thermoguttaceae bacterium]|nr:hypothetical protein [Thermoguttaceae bacterium]